jgi:hypothetical protein
MLRSPRHIFVAVAQPYDQQRQRNRSPEQSDCDHLLEAQASPPAPQTQEIGRDPGIGALVERRSVREDGRELGQRFADPRHVQVQVDVEAKQQDRRDPEERRRRDIGREIGQHGERGVRQQRRVRRRHDGEDDEDARQQDR